VVSKILLNPVFKFNKGKTKVYAGVPGNLVAFACKLYIDSPGAMHVGGRIMIIDTIAALKLINKYFPNEK
jgi:hypothetical protein